ncbi:hypothetical protein B0H11DRAFT_2198305 [Mycena galericulata]|nr:hypothetical protein B0H11DRAFT_2198305 [Mycena galericulata]
MVYTSTFYSKLLCKMVENWSNETAKNAKIESSMYGYLAGYSPDPHDRVPKLGCHEGLCSRLRLGRGSVEPPLNILLVPVDLLLALQPLSHLWEFILEVRGAEARDLVMLFACNPGKIGDPVHEKAHIVIGSEGQTYVYLKFESSSQVGSLRLRQTVCREPHDQSIRHPDPGWFKSR